MIEQEIMREREREGVREKRRRRNRAKQFINTMLKIAIYVIGEFYVYDYENKTFGFSLIFIACYAVGTENFLLYTSPNQQIDLNLV